MLLDIHRIIEGRPREEIKNTFLRRYTTLASLKAYAENARDAPLLGKIRVRPIRSATPMTPQML